MSIEPIACSTAVELEGMNFNVYIKENRAQHSFEELKHIRGYLMVDSELPPFRIDVGYYAELTNEAYEVLKCVIENNEFSLTFSHDPYPYHSIVFMYKTENSTESKTVQLQCEVCNSSEYIEKHVEILNMRKELEILRVENAELKTENASLSSQM